MSGTYDRISEYVVGAESLYCRVSSDLVVGGGGGGSE